MWCLSEFIRSLGIMRRVLASEKPPFLYIQSGPFSLSFCASVFNSSFSWCLLSMCQALCWVVFRNGEQKSSSNSSYGACSLEAHVKSVSCPSAPRWLAWNRPSINIRWLANKDAHKPSMKEKNAALWEHSSHCLWPRSMQFCHGPEMYTPWAFWARILNSSFRICSNFLHVWAAPVMRLNMGSPLDGTD